MNIYIKSFNRPFLLDKCLASINEFAQNLNGNIVVLDDGTPQKFLDKIQNKYPEVLIKKSEFYEEKAKAIQNNVEPNKNIPSIFWRNIISDGSEYFILIEDDCWFYKQIDILEIETHMRQNKLQLVKFLWMGNEKLISNVVIKETTSLVITAPELFTTNKYIFELIYKKKTCKIDVFLNKIGIKTENELLKYYQVYAVANAAFSKEYYLKAWKTTQNKVDELEQISQVIQIPKIDLIVANTKSEYIRTSLKTVASKQNKEVFSSKFDVFSLNKILNKAWFNDEFEKYDFENDITNKFFKDIISKNNLSKEVYDLWLQWYLILKDKYAKIGCVISNDR